MKTTLAELSDLRMSRFSWDFDHLAFSDHWFLHANAYLCCSRHLLTEMIDGALNSSFHHAKVAVALFEHALELFLKAAIAQSGQKFPSTHRLNQLLGRYRVLYPGKQFEFTGKVDQFVSQSAQTPHNQYARYPADSNGNPWPGNTHIDLAIWHNEIEPFVQDFERLKPLIKIAYAHSAPV
jgi:HEPN domain-containing protein